MSQLGTPDSPYSGQNLSIYLLVKDVKRRLKPESNTEQYSFLSDAKYHYMYLLE